MFSFLVFFTSFAVQVKAQITVTRQDFPDIGNLVVSALDNVTPIDPGQPGTNRTWDFGNLVPYSYDSTYYISPAGAPGYQNYPEANVITNHNPNQFPGGYNINFWNYSDTAIIGVADESLINFFGTIFMALHITYIPPSAMISFPFTYGSSKVQNFVMDWITAFRDNGVVTDSSRTISHVNLNYLADASGTLILPDGSFPALRVKEEWSSIDSSFTWTSGAWVFDSDTTSSWTQYRWYANDYGEVGFYSTNSKKGNGFTFFKSETVVGINDGTTKPDFRLYPSPAHSVINIETGKTVEKAEITDMNGRLVQVTGNPTAIDISGLMPGTYMIRVYSGNRFASGKFIKE
jgi:hypothetical protein